MNVDAEAEDVVDLGSVVAAAAASVVVVAVTVTPVVIYHFVPNISTNCPTKDPRSFSHTCTRDESDPSPSAHASVVPFHLHPHLSHYRVATTAFVASSTMFPSWIHFHSGSIAPPLPLQSLTLLRQHSTGRRVEPHVLSSSPHLESFHRYSTSSQSSGVSRHWMSSSL
ncbi:MAG: hypothetical protein J3Q66DRAFT_347071 [Benniella sp.]|nr:MAG: hypothetical protein J3Q66DRAFT_347071 [Benniella sp.]